jgi:hypothetical protein
MMADLDGCHASATSGVASRRRSSICAVDIQADLVTAGIIVPVIRYAAANMTTTQVTPAPRLSGARPRVLSTRYAEHGRDRHGGARRDRSLRHGVGTMKMAATGRSPRRFGTEPDGDRAHDEPWFKRRHVCWHNSRRWSAIRIIDLNLWIFVALFAPGASRRSRSPNHSVVVRRGFEAVARSGRDRARPHGGGAHHTI